MPNNSSLEFIQASSEEARKRQTLLGNLGPAYNATYGAVPSPQQAPNDLRQIMDMNDALAQDSLKQTVASDQANTNLLQIADQMENNATLAPGTSSYMSASAYAATLQTLAFQHKLLAAQLREGLLSWRINPRT